MDKIQFEEVLRVCSDFVYNPSKENTSKLDDLKRKLVIRAYLPAEEKMVTLYKVVTDADKSMDLASSAFTMGLELALCFDGLLAYTNIDTNIIKEAKIYETYDLLYQTGLADYILQYCEKDYNRLVRLMERTVSYENLLELMDSVGKVQPETIKEAMEEFKKFREGATPEMLHDMADILRFNDPTLYRLKDRVVDDTLEQLERIDKVEKMNKSASPVDGE